MHDRTLQLPPFITGKERAGMNLSSSGSVVFSSFSSSSSSVSGTSLSVNGILKFYVAPFPPELLTTARLAYILSYTQSTKITP